MRNEEKFDFSEIFRSFLLFLHAKDSINSELMTEVSKKYRLTSTEEPTDEMLQELMEDVVKAARESSAKAEAEKQRRLQTVATEIEAWRKSTNV